MSYYTEQIKLHLKLAVEAGAEHLTHNKRKWKRAVARGTTVLGYSDWVASAMVAEIIEPTTVPPAPAPVPPCTQPAPRY